MKAEERREQILRVAAEVFAEKGYHQASVSDIVDGAGVARGTFYQYFGNKRAIFEELLSVFMRDLKGRLPPIDAAVGLREGLSQLRRNVRAAVALMCEQRALTKILLSGAVGLDADFDEKLDAFYAELTDLLKGSLRSGQAFGIVRPCDLDLAAIYVIGALKEIMTRVVIRGETRDLDEIVEAYMAFAADGLLASARLDA